MIKCACASRVETQLRLSGLARAESVKHMLGEHFRMGRWMNPKEPERFRLSYDPLSEFYVDSVDGSFWQACTLFDFGWGDEPGYYRYPMPGTRDLAELLFTAQAEDDYYGAASVLLEGNADEALPLLEAALQKPVRYPLAAKRLAALQDPGGSWKGAEQSITRSGGESLEIETTALAVLALIVWGVRRGVRRRRTTEDE